MIPKNLVLLCTILTAGSLFAQSESPTPEPSASPAKHRSHKKTDATTAASPGDTAASPSATAHRTRKKATSEASPAASASPSASATPERRTRKKTAAGATPSASPSASKIGSWFKRKSTAENTPSASAPSASPRPRRSATAATPQASPRAAGPVAPGGGNGLVWVNTTSHVYHTEGSRFYGRTKQGKYMSEQDAIKEGNRAAAAGQ